MRKYIHYDRKRKNFFREQEEELNMDLGNEEADIEENAGEDFLNIEKAIEVNKALKGVLQIIDSEIENVLMKISDKINEVLQDIANPTIRELVEEVLKEDLLNLIYKKIDDFNVVKIQIQNIEGTKEEGGEEETEGLGTLPELEIGETEEAEETEEEAGTETEETEEAEATGEEEELNVPEEEELEGGLEL
jgi:hypothetical protein